MRTGVLCIQLGTPEAPTARALRPYLREFLSDPRVIDIGAIPSWLLLNLAILPFRPKKSAHAYAKVWTEEGSPLAVHSHRLVAGLQRHLGKADYKVALAMRYGQPSIDSVLEELLSEPLDEIVILPLYPQYASASTGSSLEKVFASIGRRWNVPAIRVIPPFFDAPGYIESVAEKVRPYLASMRPDAVLFTYHGLPERQIQKSAYSEHGCLKRDDTCCAAITKDNAFCYRAQCFATTRALAEALNLEKHQILNAFQSRLGRTPWIKPYTDEVLVQLPSRGVKRLLVVSPSFTADCLETLEEMGMRGRESFLAAGGEKFELVPTVNESESFIQAIAGWIDQSSSNSQKKKFADLAQNP